MTFRNYDGKCMWCDEYGDSCQCRQTPTIYGSDVPALRVQLPVDSIAADDVGRDWLTGETGEG